MSKTINAGRVTFVPKDNFSNNISYKKFDIVTYNGSSYFAKKDTIGHTPTEEEFWQLVAEKGQNGEPGAVKMQVVDTLPETGETDTIYLVKKDNPGEQNLYDEYVYTDTGWEHIGDTSVDLSDYYTKEESNEKLLTKQDKLLAGENITIEGNVISASGDEGIKTIDMTNNLTTNEVIALEPGIYALIGSGYIQSFGRVSGYNLIIVLKNQFNQRNCYIVKENGDIYYYMPSSGNSHLVIRYDKMLMTDNTKPYTPSGDYNPATKKYVDDQVGNINTILATLTTVSEVTK